MPIEVHAAPPSACATYAYATRTTAALRENAKQGFVSNQKAPLGFRVVKVQVGTNARNKLVPEPSEIAPAMECLRAYVANGGAVGAAKKLHARGIHYRGKPFTKDRVLAVVSEEALIGTYWFLAGLMSCGKCGASYQLETSGKNAASGVYAYRYVNCRAHLRTGKHACEGARIRLDLVEETVRTHLSERLFTRERCEAIIRETVEGQGALREKTADHRKQLQRELDEVDRRLTRYEDAFETGALEGSVLQERVRELTAKRDELRLTLAKVVPLRPLPPNLYAPRTIERFREGLRAAFLGDDQALAKTYARTLLERVVIRDEPVQLIAKPDAVVQLMTGAKDRADPSSAHSPTTVVSGLPVRYRCANAVA